MKAGAFGSSAAACRSSQARSGVAAVASKRIDRLAALDARSRTWRIDRAPRSIRSCGKPSAKVRILSTYSWFFGDEHHGAAVAHLILDLRRRRGRIDAVDDGAERLRREVADHPLLAGITHDGDAIAAREPQRRKGLCRAGDQFGVRAPASFAIDAEMLGAERHLVGRRARAFAQQERCRLAAQRIPIDDDVMRRARYQCLPQSCLVAISAPWRIALNFSHTTVG